MLLNDPDVVLEVSIGLANIALDALPELTEEQVARVHTAFQREVSRILERREGTTT